MNSFHPAPDSRPPHPQHCPPWCADSAFGIASGVTCAARPAVRCHGRA